MMYIAIDLKSFYASVECVERGLNPLTANLVVADEQRTEKTICLAVSPALKSYGIPGRARLFEVIQKVKEVNEKRRQNAPGHRFTGSSVQSEELLADPGLEIAFCIAPPRMVYYMEYSTRIYQIYLRYLAPEDIHVYSIDEVMIFADPYLDTYRMTAEELAGMLMREILKETGITATAGVGTNLYLCKIAMDIVAKHTSPDASGMRIASLDEISYRRLLWTHRPLTDFWRIGSGYAGRLEEHGMYTMGDVARCSIGTPGAYYNQELLYRLFGVNAELLIDHAWGYEPCTIAQIKAYRPENNSICSGQVLACPYDTEKTRLIVREMADALALDLTEKGLVTDQIVLTIGYDVSNVTSQTKNAYHGETVTDRYGRKVPKHAHGTEHIGKKTSSSRLIAETAVSLYDRIITPDLLTRRITITAERVVPRSQAVQKESYEQLNLFTDYQEQEARKEKERKQLEKEEKLQKAVVDLKRKFGKNAVLKGMNLEEGATAAGRNRQIGGHKA